MDELREQALWEFNLARTYNKAIEKAAWLVHDILKEELEDDEDSMHPVVEAILALQINVYPDEIEELFKRRNTLLEVKSWPKLAEFTPEQEAEYQELCKQISNLPHGHDIQDQESRDTIHDAARLIRKYNLENKDGR